MNEKVSIYMNEKVNQLPNNILLINALFLLIHSTKQFLSKSINLK